MTGWEPATVLRVIERDGDGNPSAFHVERESEWNEEQVALLQAARDLAGQIGPHGIPMDEATSPLADPNNPDGYHYAVRVRIDHAQRAINLAQKERRKAFPEEDDLSLMWRVERREGPKPFGE